MAQAMQLRVLSRRLILFLAIGIVIAIPIWLLAPVDSLDVVRGNDLRLTQELESALVQRRDQATTAQGRGVIFVTDIVTKFIPIGTSTDAALEMLRRFGFDIVKVRRHEVLITFDERYGGTKISRVSYKVFGYYEYEILLDIKNSSVDEVFARAVYRSL